MGNCGRERLDVGTELFRNISSALKEALHTWQTLAGILLYKHGKQLLVLGFRMYVVKITVYFFELYVTCGGVGHNMHILKLLITKKTLVC